MMLTSSTAPPIGVKESCIELTAHHDGSEVIVAKRAEAEVHKRTSCPSKLYARDSAGVQMNAAMRKRIAIDQNTAQPCRRMPVMTPSVIGSPAGIAKIRNV